MVSGFFRSVVSTHQPKLPIKFNSASGSKTIAEIIKESVPEFENGASFFVNPLLSSGHSQTAYTAINKFENVDLVHYKRRVLTVDSQNKFYYVNGDKMPYDRWNGQSTFAIDYVVPEGSDPDHEKFRPASQVRELPPRTEYLDPAKEQELLDNDKPLVVAKFHAFVNILTSRRLVAAYLRGESSKTSFLMAAPRSGCTLVNNSNTRSWTLGSAPAACTATLWAKFLCWLGYLANTWYKAVAWVYSASVAFQWNGQAAPVQTSWSCC